MPHRVHQPRQATAKRAPSAGSTAPGAAPPVDGKASPLRLVRPLGAASWLAERDGELAVARRLAEPDGTGGPGPLPPGVVPVLGTEQLDGQTWLISAYSPGLDLGRLLGLITLTPAQAIYLAGELCARVGELHAQGLVHGGLSADKVRLGDDGRLSLITRPRPEGASGTPGPVEHDRSTDVRAIGPLIAALLRNADRPAAHQRDADRARLGALQHAAALADHDAGAVSEVAAALDPAGAQGDRHAAPADTARAELVRLVEAAHSPELPALLDGAATRARPARRAARPVPGLRWHRPRRRSRTRLSVAAIVLLALAAVGALVKWGPLGSPFEGAVHHQARPATLAAPSKTASTAPARTSAAAPPARPAPRPVPSLGPAAAGAVTGVTLRELAPCRAGAPCTLRVTIGMQNSAQLQHASWTLYALDRCTGARSPLASGPMIAEPGWTAIYDTRQVSVPASGSVALVAVTETPAGAASAPLLMPAGGGSC